MQANPLLLKEQTPMLKTLGRIAVKTALPIGKKITQNPSEFVVLKETVKAPSKKLIESYADWAGAAEGKYDEVIPPHMFTQFALPVCAPQIETLRYNIGGIINQGCGMTIHGDIPVGEDLQVTSTIAGIEEENGRARVHVHFEVAGASGKKAVDVDLYVAFIIGKSQKKPRAKQKSVEFESLGSWDAHKHAGLEFGILTGDLNPIHWITPMAKLSPFKGKVLHGFGMFVRSFEAIEKQADKIAAIDVRFVSPVRLPSQGNEVWRSAKADQSGNHQLELRDKDGKVQMAGSYRHA